MKKFYTFFLLIFLAGNVLAQETEELTQADTSYWLKEISAGLNLNQASFSGNWQGGGVNSIAVGTFL